MASAATNLTTVIAVWSLAARDTLDLHEIFVGNSTVTEPVTVSIPNADAVETELQYTAPCPGLVPALDGLVSYIAQETAKRMVTNKYYSTIPKHYDFIQTHSTLINITR